MTYADKERELEVARLQQARNRQHMYNYLATHPCVDCGEADPVVLEFDHVRGVKEINISRLASCHASLARIDREIEKCDVRCANCHRRATYSRIPGSHRARAAAGLVPQPLPSRSLGELHWNNKYTKDQLEAAVNDYRQSGESLKKVSARHGLSAGYLGDLVKSRRKAVAP